MQVEDKYIRVRNGKVSSLRTSDCIYKYILYIYTVYLLLNAVVYMPDSVSLKQQFCFVIVCVSVCACVCVCVCALP